MLMNVIFGIIIASVALSLLGTVLGLALGLVGLVIGLAVPAALAAGVGALIYFAFKRGFDSVRGSCGKNSKAEPLEQMETEVVETFESFYSQQNR